MDGGNENIRTGLGALGAVMEMSFTCTIYWWRIQNYRDSIFMSNMQQETKAQICHQFPYLNFFLLSMHWLCLMCRLCSLSPRMKVVKGLVENQLEKLEAAKAAWPFCPSWALLGPSWSLLGLTGPYWALLGLIGPYWALLGLICYWALLGLTGPYWALLGLTGPYFAFV